jgi:hypothetical protein
MTTIFADNADHFIHHVATASEAVDEWRFNVGYDDRNIDKAWLLHDRDVWVKNPFYVGAPQPHPEDEQFDEEFLNKLAAARAREDAERADDQKIDDLAAEDFWQRCHEAEMGLL